MSKSVTVAPTRLHTLVMSGKHRLRGLSLNSNLLVRWRKSILKGRLAGRQQSSRQVEAPVRLRRRCSVAILRLANNIASGRFSNLVIECRSSLVVPVSIRITLRLGLCNISNVLRGRTRLTN